MNGSPLPAGGREVPLVRGRVVSFRPSPRIAMLPVRPRRFMPGALIRLDERRVPKRPPGRSTKIRWFVVGSVATLLLLFFVKLMPP